MKKSKSLTIGNSDYLGTTDEWSSDFFSEKRDGNGRIIEARLSTQCRRSLKSISNSANGVVYYDTSNKTNASTAFYSYGSYGLVYKLQDAFGKEVNYVLKLYKTIDENLPARQEKISKAISRWHKNKSEKVPLHQYFVRYLFYKDAFVDWKDNNIDWNDDTRIGSFLLMELVDNSKHLSAAYILELYNSLDDNESKAVIEDLSAKFHQLMVVLNDGKVGFGDLAPDNLLVLEITDKNGNIQERTLKLVDYDDMYVPDMGDDAGYSDEAGKGGFQHRLRRSRVKLSPTIHHFSSLIYYVTLLICARNKDFATSVLNKHKEDTQAWNTLFTESDLQNPAEFDDATGKFNLDAPKGMFQSLLNPENKMDSEIQFLVKELLHWACEDSVEHMPSLPEILQEFERHKEDIRRTIKTREIPIQPRDEDSNRSGSNKKEVPINPREEELGAEELCALGDKYYEGDGVQKDYKKAVEYYTKAAEKGYAEAQFNLGEMYFYGKGIEINRERAVEWYSKAAEQGHEFALWDLVSIYEKGDGVKQDDKKAAECYTKLAELGVAEGQYYLALMYYYGKGVEKNYEMAVEWYTKAAEQGHAEALYDLGNCYYSGTGVKKNYEKAVECYTKAAEEGHTEAEEQLALINKENQSTHETPRPPVTTVPDTYTVIYDGNGALDGQMKQETHTCGEAKTLQKNHFTRTGYKFLGWAKSPSRHAIYADGEVVKDIGTTGSSITLYAQWKPIQYKINYVGNGADGNDTLESIHTYNEEMRLAANIFTRKGYKFLGWATSPSYPVTYRDEDVVINLSNTDNATVNLYAVWEKELIKYTVVYDGNGAAEGSMKRETYIQDEVRKLPTNRFVRPGYKFVGWAKTRTGAVKYEDSETVRNVADGGLVVTLYAQWEPIQYKIYYRPNGADNQDKTLSSTHTYGVPTPLAKNIYTRRGYKFLGWSKVRDGQVAFTDGQILTEILRDNESDVALFAVWEKIETNPRPTTYTVNFDGNGATEGKMLPAEYTVGISHKLRSNHFSRPGYKFTGWAKSPSGPIIYENEALVSNLVTIGDSITLYAQWKPIQYKVNYQPNGADNMSETFSSTHTYSKPTPLAKNTYHRKGYKFLGWSKIRNGPVVFTDGQLLTEDLRDKEYDVSLFAVWEKLDISADTLCKLGISYYQGSGVPKDYKLAVEYLTEAVEKGHIIAHTLLAVMYHKGHGVEKDSKKAFELWLWAAEHDESQAQYMVGQSYRLGIGVEQDYVKAVEWHTKAAKQGHAEALKVLEEINLVSQTDGEPVNSPVSIPNTYTLIFDGNGATKGQMKKDTHVWNKWEKLQANQFSRMGYEFVGWATSPTGEVKYRDKEVVQNIINSSDENSKITLEYNNGTRDVITKSTVTLYAVWDIDKEIWWMSADIIKAEQGDAEAQCKLGGEYEFAAYLNSEGEKQNNNYQKAVYWFTLAAEQGHARAQCKLGEAYEFGHGVDMNLEKAMEMYTKAEINGDDIAKYFGDQVRKKIAKQNSLLSRLKNLFSKK